MANGADFFPNENLECILFGSGHLATFVGNEAACNEVVGCGHVAPIAFKVIQARKQSPKSQTKDRAMLIYHVDGDGSIKPEVSAKPTEATFAGLAGLSLQRREVYRRRHCGNYFP
jgi:hypothetical protein